jgi:IclR helix-turn-helix domain
MGERPLMIALTDAQVAEVVREASGGPRLAGLLASAGDLEELQRTMQPLLDDPRHSHSALRAVLVLAAFSVDGSERDVTEVARALSLSPSTTYRYLRTWVALGLLEQNPSSRSYRRASTDSSPPDQMDARVDGSSR